MKTQMESIIPVPGANSAVFEEQKMNNINALMKTLGEIKNNSRDIILEQGQTEAVLGGSDVMLKVEGNNFKISRWAWQQISGKLDVPIKYIEKMKATGHAKLLAENVNAWLTYEQSDKRLIRTTGQEVRAFLSSRYKVIDNFDVALMTLSEAKARGAVFDEATLTDRTLYMRALNLNTEYHIVGDKFYGGVHIRNSDVGAASVTISPFLFRIACRNGMLYTKALRQIHLGADHEIGLLSAETIEKEAESIFLKSRDIVRASLTEGVISEFKTDIEKTLAIKLTDVPGTVAKVVKTYDLPKTMEESLLKSLLEDPTQTTEQKGSLYGVVNALTSVAQNVDADMTYELQKVAGEIVADAGDFA